MQEQHRVEQYDEKLNEMKEQMRKVEVEKSRAFNELKEMKKVAELTNAMVDEVIATKRVSEPPPTGSLNSTTNQSMSNNTIEQIGDIKDNNINESKKGSLEPQLSENNDALLDKLRNEMDSLRTSEANTMDLLSDYKRKVQELEAELDKRRESEANLFDTLVMQTKQLEQNKILLEESKLEIASLEEKLKVGTTQTLMKTTGESQVGNFGDDGEEGMKKIDEAAELENKKLDLDGGNGTIQEGTEGAEVLTMKVETLLEELNSLKSELKSATVAEENSKKAMDDLAFALKEVATEANQVKAKLTLSQVELEHTKSDAERYRTMLETTEEKYKELLEVTRKEADRYKNTAERLRLEAEESLLAWNGKETEFVNCIKRTEEERVVLQQESERVLELLKEAEKKTKVSKEENQKLRDILKQALNEANVAKEAAEIAKAENARLQDSLNLLVHENEMLKIHEAASFENIRELKRMLSESSSKEFKNIEDFLEKEKEKEKKESAQGNKDDNKEEKSGRKAKEHRESKNLNKTFSLNLRDMITPHKQQQQQNKVGNSEEANNNKEAITDDDTLLKGSIFDDVDSSDSDSRHDVDMGIPDDFDHLDESHLDDSESDRNNRKRRALLRRFGDLIRRRGYHYHRKESFNEEQHLQT